MQTFGLVNSRSLRKNALDLKDYVIDHNLDLLAVTETWLTNDDSYQVEISSISIPGYAFMHLVVMVVEVGLEVGLNILKLTNHSSHLNTWQFILP